MNQKQKKGLNKSKVSVDSSTVQASNFIKTNRETLIQLVQGKAFSFFFCGKRISAAGCIQNL